MTNKRRKLEKRDWERILLALQCREEEQTNLIEQGHGISSPDREQIRELRETMRELIAQAGIRAGK